MAAAKSDRNGKVSLTGFFYRLSEERGASLGAVSENLGETKLGVAGNNWRVIDHWPAIEELLIVNPRLFPSSRHHLTLLNYWPSDELENLVNNSFLVEVENRPALLVLSLGRNCSEYRFIDRPAIIEISGELLESDPIHFSIHEAFSRVIKQKKDCTLLLAGAFTSARLGKMETTLLDLGCTTALEYQGVVDLTQSDEELTSSLRTSHKRHVKKSREFLDRVEVAFGSIGKDQVEAFQDLYLQEAGQTYSHNRWKEMWRAVLDNSAFLVSAYLGEKLVGATFCWVSPASVSYGTGVYAREYFARAPVAHFPIFYSMVTAREIGARWFQLGQVYAVEKSKKERDIAFFKRGFSQEILKNTVYELRHEAFGPGE